MSDESTSAISQDNERAVELAEETDGHSPNCPNCGTEGLPSSSKYRAELLDCQNGACAVWKFRTHRGDNGVIDG